MFAPFVQGMRELGYLEGQNLAIQHTFVDENFDLFPTRTQELLDRKVDLILASNGPAAAAAGKMTKAVPIVDLPAGVDVEIKVE